MHRGIVAIVEATNRNPVRLYCAVARLGGLSYAEIGEALRISKQGVDKHLRCVQRRNPKLGRELRVGRRSYCEAIAGPMRRSKPKSMV